MILIRQQWQELRRRQSVLRAAMNMLLLYLEVVLLQVNPQRQAKLGPEFDKRRSLRFWFPHVRWDRPNPLDVIRILLQSVWLLVAKTRIERDQQRRRGWSVGTPVEVTQKGVRATLRHPLRWATLWFERFFQQRAQSQTTRWNLPFRIVLTIIASATALIIIGLPMEATSQAILLLCFWAVALWVRNIRGRIPLLLMVTLSVLVSTRYLFWRVTQTINWDVTMDMVFGLILLSAEVYAWTILTLGYIQSAWPLQRNVAPLPDDVGFWPSVDIFIPTYNEPLSVVRHTILAAQVIDWPQEKLNVYVLDDGKRDEIRRFCEEINATYLTRPDNSHAKAGNLNHALKYSSGDYIAIFDCDHIPTRGFLQLTMGWFLRDDKLALVQTPHHFFSADPFEKNLRVFRKNPNEGELFYGLIQDGNDMWNASFFCGSCAVMKRGPLQEVGGIAVETVTEDAHTALKLHRRGYNSAYLNIPLAAGLATESLSAHIGQRIRWARGMAQIFRVDNPLVGKGLNWGQRLCYANAMLYFLNGIPRVIFLLAPLAFLLLHSYIVFAPAIMIAIYAIPHLVHANLANSRSQGKFRHSFWAEMYETVLAWYILRPTTVALISPKLGKFNVTQKGGITERSFFDWRISWPYITLITLSLLGFGFGVWRLIEGPKDEYLTVVLNLFWVTYNLILLGGAVAVAEEAKQVRNAHRINLRKAVTIVDSEERMYQVTMTDFSHAGVGLELPKGLLLREGDLVNLILVDGAQQIAVKLQVKSLRGQSVGTRVLFETYEQERAFLRATFARADAWLGWRPEDSVDKPIQSLREVVGIGIKGYQRLLLHLAPRMRPVANLLGRAWRTFLSILPRSPITRNEG